MKNYAKVGNRNGRPAYRTPAWFKNTVRVRAIPRGKTKDTQAGSWRG